MKNWLKTLLGSLALGVLAYGGYRAACAIAQYVRSLDSDLAKAIVAAAAAVLGSVITVSIGKAYETRAATLKDLRAKKAVVYEEIVHGTFNVLFADVLGIGK